MRNSNCQLCPLHQTTRNICVWGQGPSSAKIIIVSEAPPELKSQSHQLLKSSLADVGISIDEVYQTGVVKCRPPDGRPPTAHEIKACSGYLQEELDNIEPESVMLLGAVPLKAIVRKSKITELHGKIFEKGGINFMPAFSPSYAIRSPGNLPSFKYDMAQFKKIVDGDSTEDEEPDIPYTVLNNDNINQFLDEFTKAKEFSFDDETTGLFPHDPNGHLNCLGIGLANQSWIIPLAPGIGPFRRRPKAKQEFLLRLMDLSKGKECVAHNGKFDNLWLMIHEGIRFHLTFDTMLAAHLLDENSPNGLKYLARTLLGAPDYDISTREKKAEGNNIDWDKLFKYCAADVHYTLRLKWLFQKQLLEDKLLNRLYHRMIIRAARLFEKVELKGHYVNMDRFQKTESRLTKSLKTIEDEMNRVAGRKVNWNSPAQVGELMFKDLGLKPSALTGTGKPSTGEAALIDLKGKHPIIALLTKYREVDKFLSTYILGWKEHMIGNMLYLSTKLHGTVTGRYSSRLHQVPRDGTIRNLIEAPEGYTFVQADFSQAELRVVAHISDDPRMKMVFQTGGDIHTLTASGVIGIAMDEVTKEDRKKAKAVNFGFVYGMWWKKFKEYAWLKYGVKLTDQQSQEFRQRFFEIYSRLSKWHDRQKTLVKVDGFVRNLAGRIRHLPDIYSADKDKRDEAGRQAINSPVQGFIGDYKVMAMIAIDECYPIEDEMVIIKGEVHDSVLMWVRTDLLDSVLPHLHHLMVSPPLLAEFGINMKVPIEVDFEIGPWGKGKPYKFD